MTETFVFDFYNLYLPKGTKYENERLGIKIEPLKLAEEFQNNRKKYSSKYHRDGWKIAQCCIKSDNESNAKKIASRVEFLYSFAQNRSVFFLKWYNAKNGKKYYSRESKMIEYRNNNSSELISGSYNKLGYTKDISLFINKSLTKMSTVSEKELDVILRSLHAYNISNSQIPVELKFLTCWMILEQLSNNYYHKIKSQPEVYDKKKINERKEKVNRCLESCFKGDSQLSMIQRNVNKTYLYEYDTVTKLMQYFVYLKIGFNNVVLKEKIIILSEIRNKLTHNLHSIAFTNDYSLLQDLQVICQNTLFRILDINEDVQKKLMIASWFARTDLEKQNKI